MMLKIELDISMICIKNIKLFKGYKDGTIHVSVCHFLNFIVLFAVN